MVACSLAYVACHSSVPSLRKIPDLRAPMVDWTGTTASEKYPLKIWSTLIHYLAIVKAAVDEGRYR